MIFGHDWKAKSGPDPDDASEVGHTRACNAIHHKRASAHIISKQGHVLARSYKA